MEQEQREKELRIIQALLAKTVENGCTEDEAASAYAKAQQRMEDLAVSEGDLNNLGYKAKMHRRPLNVRHPDAPWRATVAGSVARNTGIFSVFINHRGTAISGVGKGELQFFGNDILVEGAALCAEYLIRVVEALSEQYARETGSGQRGRRDFAKGCAIRICNKVRESFNLASDPNLPLVISKSVDVARAAYEAESGTKVGTSASWGKNLRGEHARAGYAAGEGVDVRGHQRKAQLT